MNRRQKIIISVTGIFLVLLILVGLTYAYFLTQIQGNEEERSISVTTANLVLEYGDGNGILETDKLEPSNDFIQFKDSQGNLVPSKIFTVTNKGNATIQGYKVYLEKVQNQLVRKDDLVYTLSCKAYTNYGEETQAESGTCAGVSTETTFPDVITNIVTNDIEVGVTHVYELKAKYKEMNVDQSIDMNKLITAKINIYDSTTKFLAREIIDNASNNLNGTTLDLTQETLPRVANEPSGSTYGKTNPTIYPTELTTPTDYYIAYACDYSIDDKGKYTLGTEECPVTIMTTKYIYSTELVNELAGKFAYWSTSEITSTDNLSSLYKITPDKSKITNDSISYITLNKYISTESVLSTDYDDLGTSYYFRGGVKDNYVNFADMCWRVVRIEGDGSVKLILEDKDQLCNSKGANGILNMDGNWNIPVSNETDASLIGNFGYTLENDIYKINYLNNDGLATDYENSMSSAFKNFQDTFTNKELEKLKSGNWCFNDTAYSSSNTITTPLTEEEKQAKYNSGENFYYDSFVRLYGAANKQPTLKCNGTVMDKFGDNTTNMYVGTLTADEIVYSGGKVMSTNHADYLLNDYQRGARLKWLSFSLRSFNGNCDNAFILFNLGNMNLANVSVALSLRPAVSLSSSAVITDGAGTIENPYIVD